jgi:FixJ family two-component response regulator
LGRRVDRDDADNSCTEWTMSSEAPVVTVVDDDESVRRSLARLLTASGYVVRTFASARELLDSPQPTSPSCLLLDVRMPDLDGLELQAILRSSGAGATVVFITGHGDVQTGVRAMKSGAIDFLLKPFNDEELFDAITRALAHDTERRAAQRMMAELTERAGKLTQRERQVCDLVVAGRLNKQIAAALGTSEKTIKVHRARVMAKMGARSLADLVRMVAVLDGQRADGTVPAGTSMTSAVGVQSTPVHRASM